MKCGDNEQYSSQTVHRTNTKQEESKHGPLQKLEVRSGAMEEWASSKNPISSMAFTNIQQHNSFIRMLYIVFWEEIQKTQRDG